MLPLSLVMVLSATCATAFPTERSGVDNTQPQGDNPISIASAQLLGLQTADNSCSHRDLGFTGKLGGKWYAVYGDTLWCAPGVTDPAKDDTTKFNGMVRDSVSLMTDDPLKVHDLSLNSDHPMPHQNQFVPHEDAWGENNTWGFGGTSICETDEGAQEGAVFYLRNANDAGLQGAGVAKVKIIDGAPRVVQRFGQDGYWWNTDASPRYGDLLAYADVNSDFIYAVGGPPAAHSDFILSNYSYIARVKKADAFDLSKYEYWWGQQGGWKSELLSTFDASTAVFWGTGQGQIVWSPHYQRYILVHLTMNGQQVLLRTAPKVEGPWSGDVTAYNVQLDGAPGAYAGVAHPYLDESGKTLTVSYTKINNIIEVVKITFA